MTCKRYPACAANCGQGHYCDYCTRRIRVEAWRKMSAIDKSHDRRVAPYMASELDAVPDSCSCHISAPCSFCECSP